MPRQRRFWPPRCGAPAWRFSGSGCGRRSPRSRPSSVFSSRCPGSASGCGCRRLARTLGLLVFAAAAVAALLPFACCASRRQATAWRRLDRDSGLPHRPATSMADALAVTSKDPFSLALWNAHVERARRAARALKAGMPAPRIAWRDPYAVRALVLIACIATFVAAGGERWRRVAAAFDWHGVMLPADFRVDAWVVPPVYTGKPPIILPGIHPGETAAAVQADGPVAVPVNSTLVVRSTGKLNIAVSGTGGVAAVERRRACAGRHAGAPLQDRRHRHRDAARRRRRSHLAVQRHSRSAADHRADQGSGAAEPRLAVVVLPARRRLRRQPGRGDVRTQGRAGRARARPPPSRIRCSVRPISRWSCRRRAPRTASARPSRISPIIPGPAPK